MSGPVASNHSNLYVTILALVLGRYRVTHAEVNGTEYRGEVRTRTGTAKGKGQREHRRKRGPETKRRNLMEDVSEYREFYEGEVAD